jgi:hypothetical protein
VPATPRAGDAAGGDAETAGEPALALTVAVISAFCLLPIVWRATRVAFALSIAADFVFTDLTGTFGGAPDRSRRGPPATGKHALHHPPVGLRHGSGLRLLVPVDF